MFLTACSAQKEISKSADKLLFSDSAIARAHVGISIYDPSTNKYLYNFQPNKYFIPASNVKIFTAYVGLKYLGDSLPGMQYVENADSVHLFPTGDPTFLHRDFLKQPVGDFLKRQRKPLTISSAAWRDAPMGFGWSWDDYNSDYMVERSPFPVYGNLIRFVQTQQVNEANQKQEPVIFTEPDINWKLNFNPDPTTRTFNVRRQMTENIFRVTTGVEKDKSIDIPFVTNVISSSLELLKDTIQQELIPTEQIPDRNKLKTVFSQPTDSFLRAMMHRSDNFFAEQTLEMVSNLKLGYMEDGRLIDTILKTDLKDAPQKPRWVDGSGLSRYNLFSPYDFIWILKKMHAEYPFERIKNIFPTGGQGTLTNYYKTDSSFLFAKTGTLSGQLALSGYLITRKKKLLIFSVLINNHYASAPAIRRQVEQFLNGIAARY
jgi:serine-type D-Ala-D-Ala carboxypeptidase/endopeptidase (penicillin-binding protein 4)